MKTREQIIALAKLHFQIGHPVELDGVLAFASALGHEVADGPRHHRITIGDTFEVNGPDPKETPAWRVAPAPIERVGHPLHFRVIEKPREDGYQTGRGGQKMPLMPFHIQFPGHDIWMDGMVVETSSINGSERVWLTGPGGARVGLDREGRPIMETLSFHI